MTEATILSDISNLVKPLPPSPGGFNTISIAMYTNLMNLDVPKLMS